MLRCTTHSYATLNPFKPNGIYHSYQLDQSISVLRIVRFIPMLIEHSVTNSGDPDQMPRSVVSDLGLSCLPMCRKRAPWIDGLN